MDLTVHVKQASQVSYVILVKNILIVRNVVLEIIQLNWSCDIKFSVFLIWYGIVFFGLFSSLKKQPPSILTYINSFSSLQGMTCPTWVSSGMTKCSTNFPQLQDTFVSPVVTEWSLVVCDNTKLYNGIHYFLSFWWKLKFQTSTNQNVTFYLYMSCTWIIYFAFPAHRR